MKKMFCSQKTLGELLKEKHVVVEHSCSSEMNCLGKIYHTMKNNELDFPNVVHTSSGNFETKIKK